MTKPQIAKVQTKKLQKLMQLLIIMMNWDDISDKQFAF